MMESLCRPEKYINAVALNLESRIPEFLYAELMKGILSL